METIQAKLKERLQQSGMSIYGLAKKAGVPQSSIKNILYGKSQRPHRRLLSSIADALQCESADLLPSGEAAMLSGAQVVLKNGSAEWDADLHLLASQTITEAYRNSGVKLTQVQANQCIEELYSFAKLQGKEMINPQIALYLANKSS